MASRAARAANRGPFPVGPPPAIGEECPRCTRRSGILVMDHDAETPMGFLARGIYAVHPEPCLLCNPIPLWPLAAANLAAAYHPHREDDDAR